MPNRCAKHNRQICLECRYNTCDHGKNKYSCKACNPHLTCRHEKNRKSCKVCSPENFCEHGRCGYTCKDCKGPGICEHGKRKNICTLCGGISICQHGNYKYCCKDCEGPGICQHGIQKSLCVGCMGGGICQHQKVRRNCTICSSKKSATAQQQGEQQGEQQGHEANLDQGDIDRFDAYMQQSIQDPITFPNLFVPENAQRVAEIIEALALQEHVDKGNEVPDEQARLNFRRNIIGRIPLYVEYYQTKERQAQAPRLPASLASLASLAAADPFNPPGHNPSDFFVADVPYHDDDMGGSIGKRKRRRFTRRLPRKYNHTKKKSKLAKRKVTKRLRKNKI